MSVEKMSRHPLCWVSLRQMLNNSLYLVMLSQYLLTATKIVLVIWCFFVSNGCTQNLTFTLVTHFRQFRKYFTSVIYKIKSTAGQQTLDEYRKQFTTVNYQQVLNYDHEKLTLAQGLATTLSITTFIKMKFSITTFSIRINAMRHRA